jgi:hypothetical protein
MCCNVFMNYSDLRRRVRLMSESVRRRAHHLGQESAFGVGVPNFASSQMPPPRPSRQSDQRRARPKAAEEGVLRGATKLANHLATLDRIGATDAPRRSTMYCGKPRKNHTSPSAGVHGWDVPQVLQKNGTPTSEYLKSSSGFDFDPRLINDPGNKNISPCKSDPEV